MAKREIIIKIHNFLGQGCTFFQIGLAVVNLPTKVESFTGHKTNKILLLRVAICLITPLTSKDLLVLF